MTGDPTKDNTLLNKATVVDGDQVRDEDLGPAAVGAGRLKLPAVKLHTGAANTDGGPVSPQNPLDVSEVASETIVERLDEIRDSIYELVQFNDENRAPAISSGLVHNLALAQTVRDAGATVSSGVLTEVTAVTTAVQLIAGRANRRTCSFMNDSTATLFLRDAPLSLPLNKLTTAAQFSVKIAPGGFYTLDQPCYDGPVFGIWSAANGLVHITERF